jgi:DUF1680 family protein
VYTLIKLTIGIAVLAGTMISCDADTLDDSRIALKITPPVSLSASAFAIEDVRLLDGPFKRAMELDAQYLLKLEPDRLLSRFREYAGLKPKGEVYGGWENAGVSGHTLGHYLSACSMMYASTGDARFRKRVDYIVDELSACQKANGNGYVAAIPDGKRIFAEIAAGKITSMGFDLNGGWVPWYTLHKLLAGLLDAHRYCGNRNALRIAAHLADWAIATTANLDEEKFQRMLACEHGGMNESLAELYARTGDPRYLALSRRFHHKAVLDPLAEQRDCLPGLHANTQIPKIIGVARRYELTGDKTDRTIAEFFWDTVVHRQSYVTGGDSDGECFGPAACLSDRLGETTTETCNTYNMLKLTRHLFAWHASAKYADYYERALYNHILASQDPDTGMMCYYVPLKPGHFKTYSTPFDSFWCCVGTGIENHSKYGDSIYFHDADGLFVNLFIPSVLKWQCKGLTVRQETKFPEEDTTHLTFSCREPVEMAVRVRYPGWAQSGIIVEVNGSDVPVSSHPGSYVTVRRTWQTGDCLEVKIPMSLRWESMPDKRNRAAVLYGPIVLAGDLGSDENKDAPLTVPVFVTDGMPIAEWCKLVPGHALTFRSDGTGHPSDVTLIPFYKMHHRRYSIYWDLYTSDEWRSHEAELRAEEERQRQLDARTIDVLRVGEMQPERDHNLVGENTSVGDFRGRKWRHAPDGWFAFDMKVKPDSPLDLLCTYWGSEIGARVFDILIDGRKIATQSLHNDKPGELFDVAYHIPPELVSGKEKVTVHLQSHPGNIAGGIFGCRIVTK